MTSTQPETLSLASSSREEGDKLDMDMSSQFGDELDNQGTKEKCEVKNLTKEETKQIWIWKILVLLLLVTTASLVSVGAYIFLDREEDHNYKTSYDQVVQTIQDAAEFHASNIFLSLRSFSDTITVSADALGETFPFVTIPTFEALAAHVRSTTGAEMINWHVRVEEDQLEEWSNYTLSNYKTNLAMSRATALTLQPEGSSVKPSDFVEGDIAPLPYIPNFKEGGIILAPTYGEGPYFPAWMVSPPIFHPSFMNSDPAPWALKKEIPAAIEARRLVLTDTVPVENLANRAIKLEDHEAYHASLVDYVNEEGGTAFMHPHSAVMVPVFERLHDTESRIVGTFAVVIPWDRYLVNLLPEGVDGITCVLRNSCGKAWTYDLHGNSAYYRGEGDLHDPAYTHTEAVLSFRDPTLPDDAQQVPGECEYSYHIYATKDFEDDFKSNLPWALTLVVASTFAIMIVAFIIYDLFNNKRNKKVVGHATKTNDIVSSLFPKDVKNRLLEEAEEKKRQHKKALDPLSSFMNTMDRQSLSASRESGASMNKQSDPIADLYPNCTVYFADIAGFTAWSSSRQPVDVFRLLEAIYSEFDRICKRRRVFKVETIGDCYVAITGIPEQRKDHAVSMAKFAWDTRDKMREVTNRLRDTLGEDTGTLDLRIGLHSGPVTAGVLRGEKSRFQLFGDTVNTAARMESNGVKGRIQLSTATSDCLRERGKGNWLTAREDLIEAKGKGKLQTFWLENVQKTSTDYTRSSIASGDDYSERDPSLHQSSLHQSSSFPTADKRESKYEAELDV
ncbi:Receptor-type guanylate cyclase gcy [Seminavis robusta]|uniref:Receptor-type guanylate cyclase gcy n=1 Tax=Seminavis robusta TaxID=568900 RepID=A0A9N8DZH5_9STRA|nr:Receptor-type guanylate cyclase gcy [Seminavis robusta]|eukprot:Sro471_g149630.1 Receptor-type guanylate cyclase gcy (788) ;mRNA; r:8490-11624